ncbi:Uma2 family endonuclease [Nocardioides sp. GXZ039]|uniref:Uma2 family endonuclease n=1 Tax=Nocardioides sp. GXZ039 TaxID=3136018 RepID=UPI0030F48212
MSTVPERPRRPERVALGFEEYRSLPEVARSEYVDGHVVMTPPPTARHQRVAHRLAGLIERGAPELFVVGGCGVWTGAQRIRIPDVVATEHPFDAAWAPDVPVLVGEVVAPSTRVEDTLRKTAEYCEAGIAQYWVADPDSTRLTVLGNNGTGWDVVLDLDADVLTGRAQVAAASVVEVDLWRLLAP